MSATGRSEVRRPYDHYITPPWSLARLLERYALKEGATVLDPCAANGELLTELKRLRPDLILYAVEIRPECEPALKALADAGVIAGYFIGDFLAAADQLTAIDYVLTNPPYSLALRFVDTCNRIATIANIHLLRINFLGSQDRTEWLAIQRPGLRNLPNRPSFTGFGGDATEYGWFIFRDLTVAGTMEMLSLTPDDVISAWNAKARAMFPESKPVRKKTKLNGLHCGVCFQPQSVTKSGDVCKNGHGGAAGVSLDALIETAVVGREAINRGWLTPAVPV